MGLLSDRRPNGLEARKALWIGGAAVFALPVIAALLSREMNWSLGDFAVFGVMVFGVCALYELAMRVSSNRHYRFGFAIALFGMFVLVFVNLAVGVIGDEGNPANLAFFAIPLVGVVGALGSRLAPRGLARTSYVMAALQVAASLLAPPSDFWLMVWVTAVFTALWLAAAQAFSAAARDAHTG